MIEKVIKGLLFAIDAHDGQQRKYEGGPYIKHPIRVAEMVNQTTDDENVIIAALFHDIIEDCPVEFHGRIRDEFGINVWNMVIDLTHPPLSFGNRAARKAKETETLINASAEVQTIKLADCIDNIPSIVNNDHKFAPRFIEEKAKLIPDLNRGDLNLYQQAMKLLSWAQEKVRVL